MIWRWTILCTGTPLRAARKSLGIEALAACTGQMGSASCGPVLTLCWYEMCLPAGWVSCKPISQCRSAREAALRAALLSGRAGIRLSQPSIPSVTGDTPILGLTQNCSNCALWCCRPTGAARVRAHKASAVGPKRHPVKCTGCPQEFACPINALRCARRDASKPRKWGPNRRTVGEVSSLLSTLVWQAPARGAHQEGCHQCLLCWQAAAEGAVAPVSKRGDKRMRHLR